MNQSGAEDIVRRATAAFNAGKPDEARRLCEQGLGRAPGDPMLSHLLAAVLFAGGEIPSARGHVEASLAQRPQNAAAHLLAARIARAAKDFDGALSHLDRAIAIAPQREMFLEKARTLDQAGLRLAAREAWRAILDVIPQHQEAAARLGRLAWEDGDHAGAATLLARAVSGEAPASVWFDLGLVRQDLRDYRGAATAYRKVLELNRPAPPLPDIEVQAASIAGHRQTNTQLTRGRFEGQLESYVVSDRTAFGNGEPKHSQAI